MRGISPFYRTATAVCSADLSNFRFIYTLISGKKKPKPENEGNDCKFLHALLCAGDYYPSFESFLLVFCES
jgi:hypothetical protein